MTLAHLTPKHLHTCTGTSRIFVKPSPAERKNIVLFVQCLSLLFSFCLGFLLCVVFFVFFCSSLALLALPLPFFWTLWKVKGEGRGPEMAKIQRLEFSGWVKPKKKYENFGGPGKGHTPHTHPTHTSHTPHTHFTLTSNLPHFTSHT